MILFLISHWFTGINYEFTVREINFLSQFKKEQDNVLSSANKVCMKKSLHLGNSLIKTKKTKFPRWILVVLHRLLEFFSELKPLIETYYFLVDKYKENQSHGTPLTHS